MMHSTTFVLPSFDVETLWSDQTYIVNLKVSLCLESGGPCEISNQTVFNNSLLAFRQCQWAQDLPAGRMLKCATM